MSAIIRSGTFREWIFWGSALVLLPLLASTGQAPSFCLYKWMGWGFCPGCGLGTSIALLMKGQLTDSFQAHWLGLPTLTAIVWRWIQLTRIMIFTTKTILPC
jgi:hypothetical protein